MKLIQLFANDDFFKRLRIACSKIEKNININQTGADLYFSGVNTMRRDLVFLINKEILEKHFDALHKLSVTNFMVFVFETDEEIFGQSRVANLSDHYLPLHFSGVELFTMLTLGKKALFGHVDTIFPRKLINTSVSEIEQLINSVSQRIFWKNPDGQYIGCNHKFAGDFNLDNIESIIGKTDQDLFNEKNALEMSAYDVQILKTGQAVVGIEKEIEFKNNECKWLRINKFPHTKEGKVIGIVGIYENISQPHHKDNSLFSDEQLLQVLMDAIPDTIYFKDSESKFIRVNKAQAQLIGLEHTDEAVGKTDFDFFDDKSARNAFATEQEILFQGTTRNKLEYLGTKNGMFRWMNSIKVPIRDIKGNNVGTVGISRDVSDLITIKDELTSERDLLQLLIDHIPSPIFFKDINSVFTRANIALANHLGVSGVAQIIGKTDYDFYDKEEADEFFQEEQKIIRNNEALLHKVESSYRHSDTPKWMSTTKIPFNSSKGLVTGLVGVSHDITEQILVKHRLEYARKKAEEASIAKSNFLSNMSHEIRTPMNGIIGMADVLSLTDLDDDQRKIVDIIMRSGNNLLHIINDILDLSKIEAGKLELEKAPVSVRELVTEVREMMEFTASSNDIKLNCTLDPNIPETVLGDALRFKQVLLNLVSNAIKFTHTGSVTIELKFIGNSDSKHCILVKVIDTGIGMDAEDVENIFESFTQADTSTTRKYGGTGLGLSISNKLIEIMGGELKVNSKKGEGSTFFFEVMFDKVNLGALQY